MGRRSDILRDLFIGFIRIHILHHASRGRIFGSEFKSELERHGYCVSYGTLYPIFHRLESEGYIESAGVNSGGRIRRYYTTTPEGLRILEEAKKKIRELSEEVMC